MYLRTAYDNEHETVSTPTWEVDRAVFSNKLEAFTITGGIEGFVVSEVNKYINSKKICLTKNKFILFSTSKNSRFLRKCKLWFSDGTFKTVQNIFF